MSDINQTWMLWAILLAIAAFGLWAERLRWGARTSAVIVTLVTAMLAANIGLIPSHSELYDVIRSYLVPLAIPMLILKSDVIHGWRDLGLVAGAMALSIVSAVVGTILVASFLPASISETDWIVSTVSGLVGGHSTSPVQSLLLAAYLVLLFFLPSVRGIRQWFHEPIPQDRWGSTVEILITEHRKGNRLYLPSITLTLALSAVICTASYTFAPEIGLGGKELLLIATISLLISLVLPKRIVELSGAEDIGILIMLLLFTVIGASADFSVFSQHPLLLATTALVLVIQTTLLLVAGKYLRLSLPQLVIAANASVGGATSATAMAAARRWHTLLFPAVLCATIGQMTARPVAELLTGWLR